MSEGRKDVSGKPWTAVRLRATLEARGAVLRTPVEHRDRWLRSILRPGPTAFAMGLDQADPPEGFLDSALDTAAGVLIELPRLEADAWGGWADPRFAEVVRILRRAELPEAAPRRALQPLWSSLREAVPFELVVPEAGEQPQPLSALTVGIQDYLSRLEDQGQGELLQAAPGVDEHHIPPMPAELLQPRLTPAVARHVARVRSYLLPLAADRYWELFPAQRGAASLNRRRGDELRLDEGRALWSRPKHRYHLAAWVLKQAAVPTADIGLFLRHIDPGGLQSTVPLLEAKAWQRDLQREVDRSLAYWRNGAGARGDPPSVQLGHVEAELFDLLRPARG
jgi:hypothetical protein